MEVGYIDSASDTCTEEKPCNNKTSEEKSETLIIEVDLTDYHLGNQKRQKGKKRYGKYINWKRHMKKINRNSGEAYINYKGKPVAAKQVITPLCTCQKNCESRLTLREKEKILSEFYAMGDKDLQDAYLNSLIIVKPVKKRRKHKPEDESAKKVRHQKKLRMFSCEYTVKNDSKYFNVCKTAFCNIFVIDKSRIDLIAQKCANDRSDLGDESPKHKPRLNRIPDEALDKIMEHIRNFPYKNSQNHKDTKAKDSQDSNGVRDLHVKTMYMMYLKENHPISYSLLSKGMQAYPEVTYECYYKCVSKFNSTFGYSVANIKSDEIVEILDDSTNNTKQ